VPRARRWAGLALPVLIGTISAVGLASAAGAAGAVSLSATVNGQPAATSSDARPAQLNPLKQADVVIKVTNEGDQTVNISTVRFQGDVLSLPLFSYDTAVALSVAPGRTKSLTFPLVLSGIGSQATGLVGASITVLGPNGTALASESLVTNIHGSVRSIYGLFGLVVLLLTISSLVLALLALARHTLSPNRWARAVRFFIPGFGVGLVLTFTMSVFRVFVPTQGHWVPLLVVPSIVGLALGFLTPAPNEEEYDDYDDDVLLAQIVVVDDDPLEADGAPPEAALVGAGSGAANSRPTSMGSDSAAVPDSRPTGFTSSEAAPDELTRPSALPDTRPTGEADGSSAPDSRPTVDPVVRPTGPSPDSRPTSDT
jgi:hypothetical protein